MTKKLAILATILCMTFGAMIPVLADEEITPIEGVTYNRVPANEIITISNDGYRYRLNLITNLSEVRMVGLTNYFGCELYLISRSYFEIKWYYKFLGFTEEITILTPEYNSDYNLYTLQKHISANKGDLELQGNVAITDSDPTIEKAIKYTWGTQLEDDIDWGDVIETGFYTDIAGQGTAALYNMDTIVWNPSTDSNGNFFPEDAQIEIVVQTGQFASSTKEAIMVQQWQDATLKADYLLYRGNITEGQHSNEWREAVAIATSQSIPEISPWSIGNYLTLFNDGVDWKTNGWVYKIRWTSELYNYQSDWQVVYTLSQDPGTKETTINATSNEETEIIQVINQVNTQNNVTSTYTYQGQDIQIPDPDLTLIERLLQSIDENIKKIWWWLTGRNGEIVTPEINEDKTVEDEYIKMVGDQLQEIDTDNDLLQQNTIANSLQYIREVHRLTIEESAIGQVITLVMVMGIALYLIGRLG